MSAEVFVGARYIVPGADAWRDAAHHAQFPFGVAYVECGGLPPLFAVPACRDVLQ
jgi:hypothetical protein